MDAANRMARSLPAQVCSRLRDLSGADRPACARAPQFRNRSTALTLSAGLPVMLSDVSGAGEADRL